LSTIAGIGEDSRSANRTAAQRASTTAPGGQPWCCGSAAPAADAGWLHASRKAHGSALLPAVR
jgi:hypothetical protein